ncbi:sugar phosphate isomerase/epimerase [Rhizobium sp. BK538]|uniref:sugar phosphate isomerase/epimerase family protein n=1 Tax=Rhizobium sp. BK538 TaxID=2586984 RepID=UPI00161102E2|nr:sugar phosphate isomerase/epimerase [Rhizobium sp. BK538]
MVVPGSKSEQKIGVAHFSAISLTPSDFAKAAAGAGFSRVGLRLNPAFPGAPYYELPVGGRAAEELKAVLRGEALEVFDIEFFVIDPSFNASSLEPIVAAAANIGAKRLSACGDDPERSRLQSNFTEFCGLASGYGLAVDIENMGWRTVRTFADSVNLLKSSGAPNAGALVDGVHFFRNGGTLTSLRAEIDRVKHVQLCDVAGPAPSTAEAMIAEARGKRLAPGEGELPLGELVAIADGAASVSVEVPLPGSADAEEHLKRLFEGALRILKLDR